MLVEDFYTIYNDLKNYMISNQDKITDFNEGSIVSTIFEAVARVVEKLYIDTRIGYSNNLKQIPYSVFDFKKKEGTKSYGEVVFSSNEPIEIDTIIPVGTKVSCGDLIYSTTSLCLIRKNETVSNEVGVLAEQVGNDYNVLPGEINQIVSLLPSNVIAVSNINEMKGGTDLESDMDFEVRFKNYINGLQGNNEYALKSAILGIEGVKSVNLIKHIPPEDTYNFTIYVDDGTGGLDNSIKTKIENKIIGDGTIENPGLIAPGLNTRIGPANAVLLNIKLKASIYRTDHAIADFDIKNNLKNEIETKKIGDDIIISDLILSLRKLHYIHDVSDIYINDINENLIINDDQIAIFNSVTVEYEDI
jgi:hypothetical protein